MLVKIKMRKGMIFAIGMIFLVTAGVFAQSISSSDISGEISNYIKGFVNEEGIKEEQIKNITQIDPNNLPEEVDIKKIEKNNIGIYQVNYADNKTDKKVFVVTFSSNELKKTEKETNNIQLLHFGYNENSSDSSYIDTATGVRSSEDIGYVMLRPGSITGLSTSMKIGGDGKVNIKIIKNGQDTGFSNTISSSDSKKKDYDIQSEGVISYEAGDVISVYVEVSGDINWSDVVTIVETTS
ncbi:hypothetical protein HYW74_03745 [Candidatus Pacearchaeota archaeon]|nr:hypothetical protein [Candidatus Pacearchaeota archaeon]